MGVVMKMTKSTAQNKIKSSNTTWDSAFISY